MTRPIVPLATAAALAQRAVQGQAVTPGTHLLDRLRSLADLGTLPPVRPLIDGLLYRGNLAQIAGPPGSYKSFISLGIACGVALGRDWEGHSVPEAGMVIYVSAEGASGVRARVLACCHYRGVDPADVERRLFFLPGPWNLGNSLQVSEAVEVAAEFGAVLVVLDTRARCIQGLEENSAPSRDGP